MIAGTTDRCIRSILVTGAAGHIGSRFIHGISSEIYDDVRLVSARPAHTYPSMTALPENVPFRFIETDIFEPEFHRHLDGVDAVVHLAALTDAEASFGSPADTERINCEGTSHVARACLRHGCRLFFPSTTSIYGGRNRLMTEDGPEEDIVPQSPYAESKLNAEKYLRELADEGLAWSVCRFGTVFGPAVGMRFHTAINKFIWQASQGRPLTVWRTALHQKRPYLDVTDAVSAIDFLLRSNRFDNEIYNVATVNSTVHAIVEIIRDHVPDVRIAEVDSPIMNDFSYEVSTEKFQRLGFSFRGSLDQAIRDTLDLIGRERSTAIA